MDLSILLFLGFNLHFAFSFPSLSLNFALSLHLTILGVSSRLNFHRLRFTSFKEHVLALSHPLISVGIVLLLLLLLEQLLNEHVLLFLLVKPLLRLGLVHSQFASTALPLLPREVTLLLSLLDLVHSGGEREVPQRSDASQNDHKSKGYPSKTSKVAFTMQKADKGDLRCLARPPLK